MDDRVTASDFERGVIFRTSFNGMVGPPVLSQGPADLSVQGLEKHDPVFNRFSHAAVEESWDESVSDTSFFEFSIAPSGFGTVAVSGIDFWERRVLDNLPSEQLVDSPEGGFVNGPTQWQVRSSRDDFATVLAEGDAVGNRFAHHVASFANPFTVARGEEVSFRIYGLEGRSDDIANVPWIVDNVALIGTTQSTPVGPRLARIDPSNRGNYESANRFGIRLRRRRQSFGEGF